MGSDTRAPGEPPRDTAGLSELDDYDAPTDPGWSGGSPPVGPANREPDTAAELPRNLRPRPRRNVPPWVIALVALLVVAISGTAIFSPQLAVRQGPTTPPGCQSGTPCQVATTYVADYTAGNYERMFSLVSDASKTRFSAPAILGGGYANAHDYIVNRTTLLLQQAEAYSLHGTIGAFHTQGNTATVAATVVMRTIRVGTITQILTIPLVREHGQWRVNWSPGLVFAQLDDPNDPTYQRLVHLYPLDGHRGRILDKSGNPLAEDAIVYVVGVVPGEIKDSNRLVTTLTHDLDLGSAELTGKYQGATPTDFIPVRTIPPGLYTQVSGDLTALGNDGVHVQTTAGRVYPYGSDTAAVTGYVGDVSQQDLLNDTGHYYEATDVIGRDGVEAWAEQMLRPAKGGELDIVARNSDGSYGNPAYSIARKSAADGDDVYTTIDTNLQERTIAHMRVYPRQSAEVALDPVTGGVLELVSNPMYDPNALALGATQDQLNSYAQEHAYVNLAVSDAGAVPIGSVFKVITLATALRAGIPTTQMWDCQATYQVPGEATLRREQGTGPTWKGHGEENEILALAESCDVVFWSISVTLNQKDPNLLPQMAKGFGFGTPTGIVGLPSESGGLVPDPDWFQRTQHANWSPTDAANLAIGQGFFLATPLQLAAAMAAVANNGQRMRPRLVTQIVAPGGTVVASYPPTVNGTLPLTADNLSTLQVAMLGPTMGAEGFAHGLFINFPIPVAGKTGTAQTADGLPPHSLFACYAPASLASGPAQTPRIAIGSVIFHSGLSLTYAAPIAKQMLIDYFNLPPNS
jgi:penicillin-binding protein 2